MRIVTIISLLFLMTALPASAQTPIGKEEANAYYQNCNAKTNPHMTTKSQDAFCACTSFMMTEHMSIEDAQSMYGNTQESRHSLNNMLLNVYAPCMNFPVEDMVGTECMSNKKIDVLNMKKPKAEICGCMAKKTAEWFIQEGRTLMQDIIRTNPNIYDPLGPIMDSKKFKTQSYQSMVSCLNVGG